MVNINGFREEEEDKNAEDEFGKVKYIDCPLISWRTVCVSLLLISAIN